MLGLMRKHATSWLIKVALFAIVIVFIFWGGYSYTEKKANRVAVVNGSYIGIQEYQFMYNNLLEQMRNQLRGQFSSELVERLNLKEQALERLINRRLLLSEAENLGLEVSQQELQSAIVSYPAFQINGRFDPLRYQQILRLNRLTPQEFEGSQREDLLINKVEQFIKRTTKVLDAEIRSFYHHTRDKVKLTYALVDPDDFTDKVELNEEAVRDYFDTHRGNYRLPAQRNILYVRFIPRDYVDEVSVSEEDIEEYYRLHQEDYQQPKKVRARHILFRIPQEAKTSDIQKIQKKAQRVLELARTGEDFAKLARKYSEGPTASKGGDLGHFTHGQMAKPFADSAFSLEKGEISDLVRTRFGLHIIKVEDIREESTQSLAAAREAVLQTLKKDRAGEIAWQRAESFADQSRARDDLEKAALEQDLPVKESGFFAADEPIPTLGRFPEVSEIIFSLQPREISPVLSVGEDQLVVQLVEIQDSRLQEFGEVEEKVREASIGEQSKNLAHTQALEWLETARKQGSIDSLARSNDVDIKKTDFFTAVSPDRSLGNQRDLVIAAFALTLDQPVLPKVYEFDGAFAIVQVAERQVASEQEFQEQKEILAAQLLQAKQEQTFNRWLTARRQHSDVRILQEL
jgi:peptidyl-prolyl cis-trans isomerase D